MMAVACALSPSVPVPLGGDSVMRRATKAETLASACAMAGLTVAEAVGAGRRQVVAWKRFHVVALLHAAGVPAAEIGRRLNRDHTTILHALWRWQALGGQPAARSLSIEDACAQLGVNLADLRRLPMAPHLEPARADVVRILWADGWSARDILAALGRKSTAYVYGLGVPARQRCAA